MRKKMMRIAGAVLTVSMLLAIAAGCRREPDSLYEPPEFVFVAETLTLPPDIGEVNTLTVINDKIYFVATVWDYGDDTVRRPYTSVSTIYTMDMDGSGTPVALTGYVPPVQMPDGAGGGSNISGLIPAGDGTFWVRENWNFFKFEYPEGTDPNDPDIWPDMVDLGSGNAIRRLDSTGAELSHISLDSIASQRGQDMYFFVYGFGVDGTGNVYLSTDNWEIGGMDIYVLDSQGNVQFVLNNSNWFDQFITLPDGRIGLQNISYDVDGNSEQTFLTIDFAARDFGESISIPDTGWWPTVLPGSGQYDLLLNANNAIYGFSIGDEEAVQLLNWLDSDIVNNNIQNVTMVSDEQIVCTNGNWNRFTGESYSEILVLTKTPYSELPEKTVLTLATFGVWGIRDQVVSFNRSNPNYRIHIIDYSEFGTDDDPMAGLTRLSTELVAGRIPDILDVSNMTTQYKEYVARGLLADLYPFIDDDPTMSRGDFVEGAFRAAEIGGSLYQIFPSFYVHSLAGKADVVGTAPGWNMSEFQEVLDRNPNADIPLGQQYTREAFLRAAIAFNIDEYINWGTGEVRFDTPDFIALLEFSQTFITDAELQELYESAQNDMNLWDSIFVGDDVGFASGRQILTQMMVSDWGNFLYYKYGIFDGDLVFKGFPNENRRGNSLSLESGSLAILENSRNKDAAWEFVKTILDKDWQLGYTWAMPTNQAAFDEKVAAAMQEDYGYYLNRGDMMVRPMPAGSGSRTVVVGGGITIGDDGTVSLFLSEEDVQQVKDLIDSASGVSGWSVDEAIWNLINEGLTDYFSGSVSAEEAARVIQNRVSTLVAERS